MPEFKKDMSLEELCKAFKATRCETQDFLDLSMSMGLVIEKNGLYSINVARLKEMIGEDAYNTLRARRSIN